MQGYKIQYPLDRINNHKTILRKNSVDFSCLQSRTPRCSNVTGKYIIARCSSHNRISVNKERFCYCGG